MVTNHCEVAIIVSTSHVSPCNSLLIVTHVLLKKTSCLLLAPNHNKSYLLMLGTRLGTESCINLKAKKLW